MSPEVTVYHSLAPEHAAVAMRAEERIKARTVVTVIENGRDLLEVKSGHGLFTEWLAQTFPFSERTAQRWMSAAERYGSKSEVTSVLRSEVLLLLAAPSMPEEVREEIETRAAAGETITVAQALRLKREAKAAREAAARLEAEQRTAAETARAALEIAVRQAREQAEEAARAKADALAEEALARRRGDVAQLEQRAKAAEEKAQRHHEAEQRLAAEVRQHQEFLARASSAEREAPDQIEAAETLMAALSDAMIALHGFEHEAVPPAARKWAMAQQMSAQIADAITAFLAPRVEEQANGTEP